MLTLIEMAGWGGFCIVLNIINFFLIMTVADGWGCPKK
jgi:uncharacterized membrane protein YjfL (UPF0719 family)